MPREHGKYLRPVNTMTLILVYCNEDDNDKRTTMVTVFCVEIGMFAMKNCVSNHRKVFILSCGLIAKIGPQLGTTVAE